MSPTPRERASRRLDGFFPAGENVTQDPVDLLGVAPIVNAPFGCIQRKSEGAVTFVPSLLATFCAAPLEVDPVLHDNKRIGSPFQPFFQAPIFSSEST